MTSEICNYLNIDIGGTEYKNTQRRVYDATNVLCSLGYINKEGKVLTYIGPNKIKKLCKDQEKSESQFVENKLLSKKALLYDSMVQYTMISMLMKRNAVNSKNSEGHHIPFYGVKIAGGFEVSKDHSSKNLQIATTRPPKLFDSNIAMMSNVMYDVKQCDR